MFKYLKQLSLIALTALSSVDTHAASAGHTASAPEACANMTFKLVFLYEQFGFPATFYSDKSWNAAPLVTAETVVGGAFGMTKHSLDKKWPGFYDWSTLAVLTALNESQSPSKFQLESLRNCIERYQ